MTYLRFETPKAKYILAMAAHTMFNRPITPQKADAIVLEGTTHNLEGLENSLLTHPINRKLLFHAIDNRIPIFNVDVAPSVSWENLARGVLSPARVVTYFIPFRNASTSELGPVRNAMARASAKLGRVLGDPVAGMRSAIMADRIERHVVPRVTPKSGKKEKPTIFIAVGAAHADIRDYLENPGMRRRFLRRFNPLGRYYVGEQVHRISKYSFKIKQKRKKVDTIAEQFSAPLPDYPKKSAEKQKEAKSRLARMKSRKK